MIKVLIVEDSRTVSQYLEYLLSSHPDIKVIGNVANGQLAIDFVNKEKPDIITMDIDMPIMNGLEATRKIMATTPVPIVVVTASRNAYERNVSIEALAAGALTVIQKPVGIGHPNEAENVKKLLSTVVTYSQVKVVKRKPIPAKTTTANKEVISKVKTKTPSINTLINRKLVAIGISSGGPQVLMKIFSKISGNFPYPILVVQHITHGFLEGMVVWLDRLTGIPVRIASDNEVMLPGHIYFAPDKFHMGVNSGKIALSKCGDHVIICPSTEHLFNSLAQHHAKDTIAIILTGMGSDGATGLKKLKDAGALTIAQDEESSLVHGMPGKAIELDGASYILDPDQISSLLVDIEETSLLTKPNL